jgi:hypothetical protein
VADVEETKITVVCVRWSIARYSVVTPWRCNSLLRNVPNAPIPVLAITADSPPSLET